MWQVSTGYDKQVTLRFFPVKVNFKRVKTLGPVSLPGSDRKPNTKLLCATSSCTIFPFPLSLYPFFLCIIMTRISLGFCMNFLPKEKYVTVRNTKHKGDPICIVSFRLTTMIRYHNTFLLTPEKFKRILAQHKSK